MVMMMMMTPTVVLCLLLVHLLLHLPLALPVVRVVVAVVVFGAALSKHVAAGRAGHEGVAGEVVGLSVAARACG